jgi:thiol-disulfide isomerase/thioredoxin
MDKNLDISTYIDDDNLNKGKDNIIVFVYMIGCGPCGRTHPIFDKLSSLEDKNCSFIKINCNDIPQFLSKEEIEGFPAFLWFCKLDSGNKYKLNYKASGIDQLNITLNKVKQSKQNTHEYYIPENSTVNAYFKKGYSINGIINETLRKFNR